MRYAVEAGQRLAGRYTPQWFRDNLAGAAAFALFNELRQSFSDVALMDGDNKTLALYDARGIERAG